MGVVVGLVVFAAFASLALNGVPSRDEMVGTGPSTKFGSKNAVGAATPDAQFAGHERVLRRNCSNSSNSSRHGRGGKGGKGGHRHGSGNHSGHHHPVESS